MARASTMPGDNRAGSAVHDSVLDEAKGFRKGRGRMIAAMLAAALAAAGVLTWYLGQNQPDSHRELGKQVNGIRAQFFDGFMACVLPGKQLDQLKSDADLRIELHGRASAGPRYGTHLRERCASQVRELAVQLRGVATPAELAPHVQGMAAGVTKMSSGLDGYAAHVENLSAGYDEAAAEPELEPLVRGWYEFRKTHAELNQVLRGERGR